jgi:iron complex outermembrane receptor protein
VPGLQFSASYWQIDMKQLVTIPPLFVLAASDPGSTNRVMRAERTAQDIAAGVPGVLTYIDLSRINAGSLKTSGVDLAAKYVFETSIGSFEPNLSATWVNQYETMVFPGERPTERTGVANRNGTIPRWRIIGSLGWSLRGLSMSTTVRHTPHYWDTNGLDQIVDRHVDSQTLVDAQVSLDLGALFGDRSRWSGLRATAGASNLFNQEPSFSEVQKELGFDPSQGDLKQRFGYIKLSKRF